MKMSKKRQDILGELPTNNNTASSSNYASVGQLSALHVKIQNLEASLEMSLKNQKTLNQNLEYMLEVERILRRQLQERDIRIKNLQKQATQRMQQLEKLNQSLDQVRQILVQSQSVLQATKQKLVQKQTLLSRKQTTIREQKKVIQSLENQKLYNNLNGFNNIAKQQNDNLVYQLKQSYEKKVNQLQYQLKRSENSCYSQKTKTQKLEKELNEFKRWLCKLVGIDKLVAGCQKMIMNQVTKRLSQ